MLISSLLNLVTAYSPGSAPEPEDSVSENLNADEFLVDEGAHRRAEMAQSLWRLQQEAMSPNGFAFWKERPLFYEEAYLTTFLAEAEKKLLGQEYQEALLDYLEAWELLSDPKLASLSREYYQHYLLQIAHGLIYSTKSYEDFLTIAPLLEASIQDLWASENPEGQELEELREDLIAFLSKTQPVNGVQGLGIFYPFQFHYPGAHNAGSNGFENEMANQTSSISKLFDMGVRAFLIDIYPPDEEDNKDSLVIRHGDKDNGEKTHQYQLKQLKYKLDQNPNAFVVLVYENHVESAEAILTDFEATGLLEKIDFSSGRRRTVGELLAEGIQVVVLFEHKEDLELSGVDESYQEWFQDAYDGPLMFLADDYSWTSIASGSLDCDLERGEKGALWTSANHWSSLSPDPEEAQEFNTQENIKTHMENCASEEGLGAGPSLIVTDFSDATLVEEVRRKNQGLVAARQREVLTHSLAIGNGFVIDALSSGIPLSTPSQVSTGASKAEAKNSRRPTSKIWKDLREYSHYKSLGGFGICHDTLPLQHDIKHPLGIYQMNPEAYAERLGISLVNTTPSSGHGKLSIKAVRILGNGEADVSVNDSVGEFFLELGHNAWLGAERQEAGNLFLAINDRNCNPWSPPQKVVDADKDPFRAGLAELFDTGNPNPKQKGFPHKLCESENTELACLSLPGPLATHPVDLTTSGINMILGSPQEFQCEFAWGFIQEVRYEKPILLHQALSEIENLCLRVSEDNGSHHKPMLQSPVDLEKLREYKEVWIAHDPEDPRKVYALYGKKVLQNPRAKELLEQSPLAIQLLWES